MLNTVVIGTDIVVFSMVKLITDSGRFYSSVEYVLSEIKFVPYGNAEIFSMFIPVNNMVVNK